MIAVYTAEEILDIASGRLASGLFGSEAGSISTDTRSIKEGEWFLALEGARYDGHDFLGDAFACGAIGGIVAERTGYAIGSNSFPLIAVDAPLAALSLLARNWRRRINPQVIVLCGKSSELAVLIETIEAAATFQQLPTYSCLSCQSAQEAANFVTHMDEQTRLMLIGFCPRSSDEVEKAALALEPNLLSFVSGGLDNLRLTSSEYELKAAKLSLINNQNKIWAWLLSSNSAKEDEGMRLANERVAKLSENERFFERVEWQSRGAQMGESLARHYEQALITLAKRFPPDQTWLCVNACGLVGIRPSSLIEILS